MMEVTRDLKCWNLLVKLMVLHRQILFSLAIAAIAEEILKRIFAQQVSSLQRQIKKQQQKTQMFCQLGCFVQAFKMHVTDQIVANNHRVL